jgi:TonB family protein
LERPKPGVAALPTVIHQEIPEVPRSARESVRGVIKVAVRVSVDRSGNVVAATLEHRASSRYFDRAATDAATKWKFTAAPDSTARTWLLHFEFTRAGATAHATALR